MILHIFSLVAFLTPTVVCAQEVQKISLNSTRNGWGFSETKTEIVKKEDGYYRGAEKIDSALVQNLMKVLKEPLITKLNFENLDIGQPWVIRNKKVFLGDAKGSELRLLNEALGNPIVIEQATMDYYKSFWTDDIAALDAEITTSEGVIKLQSHSQHEFMIPWTISQSKGNDQITWNANFGRTIAALLPNGAANQDRLFGYNLASRLSRSLKFHGMRDVFDRAKAKEEFPTEMKTLEEKYRLSDISSSSILGLGVEVDGLHMTLSGGDLPAGVVVDGHLPKQQGQLKGLKKFLKIVPVNGAKVSSVTWLMKWLKSNPTAKVEITMVDDISITDKGKNSFRRDFSVKRPNLLKEVSTVWDQSLLVTINQSENQYSRWLVLPDQRMLLWHATGVPILNWKKADLPKSWGDYGQDIYGVFVSKDGKLESGN